jgi:hypothetical protein
MPADGGRPPVADDGRAVEPRVRDRHVLLIAAAVILFVLGLRLLSDYVPAVDDALAGVPLLIIGLVVGTLIVLARAVRR